MYASHAHALSPRTQSTPLSSDRQLFAGQSVRKIVGHTTFVMDPKGDKIIIAERMAEELGRPENEQ